MANSTATPAAPAKLKSDWYTFLRSAFIDGLKAYGAALMVAAPEPTLTLSKIPSHLGTGESSRLTPMGAPCLPVLETWETKMHISPSPELITVWVPHVSRSWRHGKPHLLPSSILK